MRESLEEKINYTEDTQVTLTVAGMYAYTTIKMMFCLLFNILKYPYLFFINRIENNVENFG